jgi:endonuclease-3
MATTNIVNAIFKRLKTQNPHPATELVYHSHFELLIAVMLSAQATDKSVNLATPKLFKVANTPEQILALGETQLKTYIKTIGLFNSKAKNIIKTCELLVQNFNSTVPNTRAALESLPGVGRKTANVILNTAFGAATIAVDTHIFRVAQRLGLAQGTTPLAVEMQLEQIIPKTYKRDAHHWLILHGRYICKAIKPKCYECFLIDLCPFPNKQI